jgi:hypothetical protein
MPVKPGFSESVYEAAWRDPRGMVKATCLNPSPQRSKGETPRQHAQDGVADIGGIHMLPSNLPVGER